MTRVLHDASMLFFTLASKCVSRPRIMSVTNKTNEMEKNIAVIHLYNHEFQFNTRDGCDELFQ